MIVRTFDNRVNAETGDKKHECHHHNSHAYGTIHSDVEDCECGSMAEPMDQEPNHCRFEFPSDIYKKFIQTHDSRMCKSKFNFQLLYLLGSFRFFREVIRTVFSDIYDHCADCTGYQWKEYSDVMTPGPGGDDVKEHIPGHCIMSFPK